MKIAAFLLVLLFAGSAHADWQFTRWGMTVDEVLAAGNKQVERSSEEVIKNTVKYIRGPC
jgi:hypothetical protein